MVIINRRKKGNKTKCKACGHEKGHEWVEDEYKGVNPGGKEFIEIKGNFTVKSSGYHQQLEEVYLYACPICKAVILEN